MIGAGGVMSSAQGLMKFAADIASGTIIVSAPLKIRDGSGSPLRVLALIGE
jgi:kynurenine formamidase